jgi:succinyl-CoA synthetase beta subunit
MSLINASRRAFRPSLAAVTATQKRFINLHEYQSKGLMQGRGIPVQKFKTANTAAEAEQFAKDLAVDEIVMKAQVFAGGRGKGTFDNGFKGGVHLSRDPAAIGEMAGKMLGFNLVTKQTPPGGVPVTKVMVAEALDIAEEKYFAIVMDREYNGPVMMGSPEGGVDIEEVAESNPDAIFTSPINIDVGVTDEQAAEMAKNLKFEGDQAVQAAKQFKQLYDLFWEVDSVQVEINPFATTPDGRVVCFDAKIAFDDNASFRQKEIFADVDTTEDDPREVAAAKLGLNYVGMDGNIGCLVNGAGLAMGTMDIIKLYGGEPANFLDCGGGVTPEGVTAAFNIITSDPQVKAILVNIFGGIVNCATVAEGIVAACKATQLKLPLVVRLEGTNVEAGKQILIDSGLPIINASDLDDAAQKAVATLTA